VCWLNGSADFPCRGRRSLATQKRGNQSVVPAFA
jgi:hypothetical protein